MSFEPVSTIEFGKALVAALGLPKGGWDRIVIVADINNVPQIYVRGFLNSSSVSGVVQAVKDVQVSADGDIAVVPLAEEITEDATSA